MKVALVGVGAAGTRIVDRLVRAERTSERSITAGNVLAYDTAGDVFDETTEIPANRQILLGDAHPAVVRPSDRGQTTSREETAGDEIQSSISGDTTEIITNPQSTYSAHLGVGGDPDAGATVANDDLPEIRRALDLINETEVAATMVIAGLGGGTGAGVGSVLLDELQSIHDSPVYALGVLPAVTEPGECAHTAARAIRTIVPLADAVFPVDNEAWRCTDPVSDCYADINDQIATHFLALFGVGEQNAGIAGLRIDPADIQRTLAVGGISSIGHQTLEMDAAEDSWLARLWQLLGATTEPSPMNAAEIKDLVRHTINTKLTVPCSVGSADRVLLLLSAPPSTISRKGFETGRYLLEKETGTVEILAGDESCPGATTVTATIVFSNVTNIPCIEQLQTRASCYVE